MTEEKTWKTTAPRELVWFCAKCHESVRWDENFGSVFTEVSNGDGEEMDEVLCNRCYERFLKMFESWLKDDDAESVDQNPTESD